MYTLSAVKHSRMNILFFQITITNIFVYANRELQSSLDYSVCLAGTGIFEYGLYGSESHDNNLDFALRRRSVYYYSKTLY